MDVLTGSVERITYYNEENGYSVIKVMPDTKMPQHSARDGTVTVVGTMPELAPGESAEFAGTWIEDPRYGLQLRVERIVPILPTSMEGITRYLSSGIVKGIGPRTAEHIVQHFGVKTLEILNREPHRLREVPQLKASLADKLAIAWEENAGIRQTMIFLQGYGVSIRMAGRIYAQYGTQTIETVQKDPYTMADDVFGIGFIKADQIAQNMGVEFDAPSRMRAGLLYALNRLAMDGHTYAPREVLLATAGELLQIEDHVRLAAALDTQVVARNIISDTINVEGREEKVLYLPVYYHSEKGAAKYLRELINTPSPMTEENASNTEWAMFLAELTEKNFVELTEQQQGAVKAAFTSKVSVLTGGPGTGKTTTVQMVISALEAEGYEYKLASPTGRAAKRLAEASGREASTIHRLLGYTQDGYFEHDDDSPLELDMLIVDEASMIDLILFYNLLKALPPQAHLMLVGDIDQLPSVGAGNVLHDVIDSRAAHVTRLQTIFRQSETSHIVVNAHRVNQGDAPFMDNRAEDFYFFGAEDPAEAAQLVVDVVKNRIPNKFGFDPVADVQVIAPMYRGPAGINTLNEMLQRELNGNSRKNLMEKTIGGKLFRVGDKVMQTRNNYDKNVFNGDIGRVRAIDDDENLIEVVIDEQIIAYDYTEADDLIHAYCISTHRSQGSEYPVVVLPILTQHYMMLQRNLMYTAITRARSLVVMVGSRKAVFMAVKNNKVAERYSGLLGRLQGM